MTTRLTWPYSSLIFGIGIAAGSGVSASFLAAVIVSNVPQALAPLLAMLTNSLMPFAFDRGGRLAGMFTAVGFALAVLPR